MEETKDLLEIILWDIHSTICDRYDLGDKKNMNRLIEENYVSELKCGTNFSYIINDKNLFMPTEYKVLISQSNSSFLKCMKMFFNGKIQIYYLTGRYVSFASILHSLDYDNFVIVISNLFGSIIEAKNNGFLSCQNIDISFEHIYVDTATYKVMLVYVPIRNYLYNDISSFENELRVSIIKLISSFPKLSTDKSIVLSSDLQNGSISIEELFLKLKKKSTNNFSTSNYTVNREPINNSQSNNNSNMVKLVALNSNERIEFVIDKDIYVIGKKQSLVNGVVTFNKMISRVHCQILNKSGRIYVEDLNSANGTFVNRVKLQANVPYEVRNGDMVRLANSDFQIVIP